MRELPSSLWVCTSCRKSHEYKPNRCTYTSEDYVCNHTEFVEYRPATETDSLIKTLEEVKRILIMGDTVRERACWAIIKKALKREG